MRRILVLAVTVMAFVLGIMVGRTLFVGEPSAPSRPTSPSVAVSTPSVETPEQTILSAVELMKPRPKNEATATRSARELATRLLSNGYYYWVTYPVETNEPGERINHREGSVNEVGVDLEIKIDASGRLDDIAAPADGQSVFCSAKRGTAATFDSIETLVEITRAAAKAHTSKCRYVKD